MSAAALLAAVRAAPADDAPRLVYADWLDEHGQPERAEFIRLQCELARTDDPALRRREAELLAAHHDALAGPLAAPHLRFRFERGFIAGFGHTGVFQAFDPERRAAGAPSHLLRFWPDGCVISASSIERLNEPPYWFGRPSEGRFLEGEYSVDVIGLPFRLEGVCRSSTDTLDFHGVWIGHSLHLHLLNRRLGRYLNRQFEHVHFPILSSLPGNLTGRLPNLPT
jgi:uncharacterized protein (TIGR02996 family)